MIGERRFPTTYGQLFLPEGAFGRDFRNRWWARPPKGDKTRLNEEDVVEHADGTITVAFSGWSIERGVWNSKEMQA